MVGKKRNTKGSIASVYNTSRRGMNMNRKLMMIMAVVLSFALLIGCAKNNSSDSSSATNSGSKNSTGR